MADTDSRPLEVMSSTAQLYPSRIIEVELDSPWKTLTAIRVVSLATPYVVPPMVPATWVPCPTLSTLEPPTALYPYEALLPNSV